MQLANTEKEKKGRSSSPPVRNREHQELRDAVHGQGQENTRAGRKEYDSCIAICSIKGKKGSESTRKLRELGRGDRRGSGTLDVTGVTQKKGGMLANKKK